MFVCHLGHDSAVASGFTLPVVEGVYPVCDTAATKTLLEVLQLR